jgi:hypothetical protein
VCESVRLSVTCCVSAPWLLELGRRDKKRAPQCDHCKAGTKGGRRGRWREEREMEGGEGDGGRERIRSVRGSGKEVGEIQGMVGYEQRGE